MPDPKSTKGSFGASVQFKEINGHPTPTTRDSVINVPAPSFPVKVQVNYDGHELTSLKVRCVVVLPNGDPQTTVVADLPVATQPVDLTLPTPSGGLAFLSVHLLDQDNNAVCGPHGGFQIQKTP